MTLVEGISEDLRYSIRTIRFNPGFALVAILSLALGIGANTAIFSLIDALLLRQLPVADPQRIVLLSDPNSSGVSIGIQNGERSLFTYQEFERLRDSSSVFSGMFASESSAARLNVRSGNGPVDEVRGKLVSGGYFEVLGVRPVLGRTFTQSEDSIPGADPVVVLTYDYWRDHFGLDAGVLGKSIEANRVSLTIIGVTPPGFRGETVGDAPGMFIPMMMERQVKPGRDWLRDDPVKAEKVMWLHVGGRLKPGLSIQAAQANIDVVLQQYLKTLAGLTEDPARRRGLLDQRIVLHPGARGASYLREGFAEPLWVLMAMVGLVLLIACSNVANLLLARATARQKEIGVRLALGAGRLRIVRQLLTESTLLSLFGGALGVLFAYWTGKLLLRLASSGTTPVPLDLRPDPRVLAFTAALAVLTGITFGLAPALRAARVDVNSTLKQNIYRVRPGSRLNTGATFVVAQISISLILLIGAGLFVRTLRNLKSAELGYNAEKLLIVRIDPVAAGYKAAARADVFRRVLEALGTVPGVRAVTLSENGLFSGTESGDRITVEGYHSDKEDDNACRFDQVGPGYFSTVGIPMRLGREILPADNESAPMVCVVNEAFARFYFGRGNPIGKHVTDEFPDTRVTFEIVGVAADAKDHRLRGEIPRRFYVPLFHSIGEIPPSANYEIRTIADPNSLLPAVRRTIQGIDGSLPVLSARSLPSLLEQSVTQERMIAEVSAFFGILALVLAGIGLYGVLAYSIARRTREIGIRIALGAERSRILSGVFRETILLASAGAAIGLPAALALGRLVQSKLFGLAVADPSTFGTALGVIVVVAAAAGYVPARRASRIDPYLALRQE